MTETHQMITLHGDEEVIKAIHSFVDAQPDNISYLTEQRNLGGGIEWIVIIQIAIQTLPIVLNFIKDYLAMNRIDEIKIGDFMVKNPSPEVIDKIIAQLEQTRPEQKK